MRDVEKTTECASLFVENADFLDAVEKVQEKNEIFSKKRLTDGGGCGIITKQMKQNSRSHPAANGVQRLICSSLRVLGVRSVCFARFFILPGLTRELEVPFY